MPRQKTTEPTRYAVKNDKGYYFSAGTGWATLSLATLYTTRARASETAQILRDTDNHIRVVAITLKDAADEQPPAQPAAAG